MKNQFTRRQLLTIGGAAASAAFLGPSLFNPDILLAASPIVRRDVGGMNAYDPILMSYQTAITAMKALPNNNPLSWVYQAAIHGNTVLPPQVAWNTCQHGNYFFWSWHRMYLYWFERIIRKMCGDPCWALPYWNWSSVTERQLPAPFRDPASTLYTSFRNPAMNSGAGSLPASDVSYSSSFSQINFTTASSIIQGTPHGAVHVDVGGWMSSVPTAAQDPIFYLHHANCDRLWDLWLAQGGGRTDPLSDATWKNTQFTFFNESGAQVKMTACDILRAAEQLHYVYEGEPPQVNEYCLKIIPPIIFAQEVLFKVPIPPITLGPEPVSFPVELKQLRERLAPLAESKTETLFLELDDVEAERQPGAVWEVYFGLPPNTEPNAEGPYYLGNVVLFGEGIRNEAHKEFKPAHFAFPLNRALVAAMRSNEERVLVTFVPRGILIEGKPTRPKVESPVKIGSASLTVERRKQE